MELEPRSLNIPLTPRNRFWFWAVAIVAAAGLLLRAMMPAFGSAFLAAAILLLPALMLCLGLHGRASGGVPRRFGPLLALVAFPLYARVAQKYLLPTLLAWLQ